MPNPESSDGNFATAWGQIGRRPGQRWFLIWARILECCLPQRSNEERRIYSLMKRKWSELEERSENRMERRSSACLAAESTFSLSGIPLWLGAQMKGTGTDIAVNVVRRECIRVTSRWEEDGWTMAESAAKKSEMINSNRGLKISFSGKMSSVVLYESLWPRFRCQDRRIMPHFPREYGWIVWIFTFLRLLLQIWASISWVGGQIWV